MNSTIKNSIVSAVFAATVLNSNANNLNKLTYNELENQINIELSNALDSGKHSRESSNLIISPDIVIKAVFDYFDEEVKKFELKAESKIKISKILNSYLSKHPILVTGNQWRMEFVIDDKAEFIHMAKEVVNIIIDDMPFFVKKIGIPLFFGWNSWIQHKLDNLNNTMFTMKEKEYKDIIFDYVWWIVKRVAQSINWKMTTGEYYYDVSSQFPNKNSSNISTELNNLWLRNQDIKNLKYPFNE